MGWAKFVEDNMEMREERFYQPISMDRYRENTYLQVCTILPMVSLPIEVKVTIDCQKETLKPDRVLYCKDCGKEFVFSGRAQRHYDNKGYVPPKRCHHCRELNKIRRVAFSMGRP